jgi:nicotinamidase-related amidase
MRSERVRTLVVVDMQPYYTSSQVKSVMKAVVKEVEDARKAKQKVVVVQYGESNDTELGRMKRVDPRVLHPLEKYPKVRRVVKKAVDGGNDVAAVLSEEERNGQIDFCGVEQSVCVKETAQTTKKLCPTAEVNVLTYACNDYESRTYASQLVKAGVQVI